MFLRGAVTAILFEHGIKDNHPPEIIALEQLRQAFVQKASEAQDTHHANKEAADQWKETATTEERIIMIELMAVKTILKRWKNNPHLRRIDFKDSWSCDEDDPENYRQLGAADITRLKQFLKTHAPTSYSKMFPEEADR